MLTRATKRVRPGTIVSSVNGSYEPGGYLTCNGSSQLIATYPALSAAIRATYGGVDADHFNLPDFLGRTLVDYGSGTGLTARSVGDTGGEEAHVLTVAELAQHDHQVIGNGTAGAETALWKATSVIRQADSGYMNASGSDTEHQNMQPFAVVVFYIKY